MAEQGQPLENHQRKKRGPAAQHATAALSPLPPLVFIPLLVGPPCRPLEDVIPAPHSRQPPGQGHRTPFHISKKKASGGNRVMRLRCAMWRW